MATAAQIAANRRNAMKSTGPKTVQGKDRSRMNALVHGLRANVVTYAEDEPLRKKFREQLAAEWNPGSTAEAEILDQLVETMLRLRRIPEAHDAAMESARARPSMKGELTDALVLVRDLASKSSYIQPILDYEKSLSRQQSRLLRELRDLQRNRVLRDQVEAEEEEANLKTEQTKPIMSQVVQGKTFTDPAHWPVGPNGEPFDEWNRPDRDVPIPNGGEE